MAQHLLSPIKQFIALRPKLIWPLLVIAASLLVFMLLVATKPVIAPSALVETYPAVRVQQVQPLSQQMHLSSQGTVKPRSQSELIPEVNGVVVWMSPVLVSGGFFEAGEELLRIDRADYESTVARNAAAVTRAEVEYETANAEYRRNVKLSKQKLASQSQLDQVQRNYRVAEANLVDARINLKQAQRDLARTALKAPFTGRVSSERVDLGQFVSRGGSVATLYATDEVEVRLPISNKQLGFLKLPEDYRGALDEGQATEVTLSGSYGGIDYRWPAKLVRTEGQVDTDSRMFYAVASASNREFSEQGAARLPPLIIGLFVKADIVGRVVDNVVTLPRVAMRDNNQVLVVDGENRLRFRDVEVLRMDGEQVLISAGLAAAERVCVSPLQVAVEGMIVEPVPVLTEQTAATAVEAAVVEEKTEQPVAETAEAVTEGRAQ